tara:strand:- start:6822 stop:7034 length:213 start_codon:yes stop_codon:yes gene_type:complete
MATKTKNKNDISLDKNISDSFTKLPELRLGEQFSFQSSGVVELYLELFSSERFAPGDNYNILFLTFLDQC